MKNIIALSIIVFLASSCMSLSKKDSASQEAVKRDTEAVFKQERYPVWNPKDQTIPYYEVTEKTLRDASSSKEKEKESKTVLSGMFFILLSVAFAIASISLIALAIVFRKEKLAMENAVCGVAGSLTNAMKYAMPDSERFSMAKEAMSWIKELAAKTKIDI